MYGRTRYSKEELIEFVLQFIEKEGRVPKQRDFLHNKEYPSFRQYIDTFGSWSKALIEIGCRDTQYPVNKNEHICSACGKKFHAYGNRKYCSDECRYVGRRRYSNNSSNVTAYRKKAFSEYPWHCAICGYEENVKEYTKGTKYFKYPVILDVHHLDENRENNELENLLIVCPTCHALIHRGIIKNVHRHPLFRDRVVFDKAEPFGDNIPSPFEEYKAVL